MAEGQTYAQKVHVEAQGFNMSDLEWIGILLGQQPLNAKRASIKAVEWQRCGQPHIHALMLITAENMYVRHQASIHWMNIDVYMCTTVRIPSKKTYLCNSCWSWMCACCWCFDWREVLWMIVSLDGLSWTCCMETVHMQFGCSGSVPKNWPGAYACGSKIALRLTSQCHYALTHQQEGRKRSTIYRIEIGKTTRSCLWHRHAKLVSR